MKNNKSIFLIVSFSLFVGLLHFLIGPEYQGPLREFMTGYLIDLLLPMNLYLLLQLAFRSNISKNTGRIIAASIIVLFGTVVEIMQSYQIEFLGSTFDPVDLVMYITGVLAGVAFDVWILEKLEK